ncbi:hypothetical protein SB18R_03195 [Pseudomonas oryzihabitans]|nr:hypothetical protein SB9_12430 [Pseudomonas psychrotolerans]KTT78253.1 hypothetical protein SB18R_03195 [Pseudomonas psychrotolerans]
MRQAGICAPDTLVTLDGVTQTALEWAVIRKLKWETVRQRRYRGSNWRDSLRPAEKASSRRLGATWMPSRSDQTQDRPSER